MPASIAQSEDADLWSAVEAHAVEIADATRFGVSVLARTAEGVGAHVAFAVFASKAPTGSARYFCIFK